MNKNPTEIATLNKQLMQMANGFRQSILLLNANRQGVFDLLAKKTLNSTQVATAKGWDVRATGLFLNALVSMGLLNKTNGLFSNSDLATTMLVAGSPYYQGDILRHNQNLLEHRWIHLSEVLKTGKPVGAPVTDQSEARLHDFIAAMANSAQLTAESLWREVDLSRSKRLLDVGGGPGSFAFEACSIFPALNAVVFDLPEVKSIFQEFQAISRIGNRVSFHAGDYLENSLPGEFDVALLSNIIHSLGEAENLLLLSKVREALLPGGIVIIKDFFVSTDGTHPLWTALFAVNMLVGTESGSTYSRVEVESWLSKTGFEVTQYLDLTEQTGVLIGKKV
jgi:SAM-dependent methyltransferase